ncbi:hypothetical protein PsYK624_025090 [Phanerochaete sordida]|uniref:Uncharacterized protein n=1 Tax=Phanerochaete sordida TaxID=48140 RepID=A0A9P3G211_9APHY|nr:hypothetical protein PsYK624_025090 [Phanerochaete sordida]
MPNPPPQPAGVDPRAWTGGQWQWNPMFQGNPAAQATLWAPHASWGIPAAAAPAYNPYKRKLNTGDAAYWATDLSKNPLGLENLFTAEQLEQQKKEEAEREGTKEGDGAPQTPWLWVPKELSKSEGNPAERPEAGDGRAVRDSQSSSQPRQYQHPASKQPHSASASMSAQQMQEQQQRSLRHHHHHSSTHRSLSQNIFPSSDSEGTKTIRRSRAESLARDSVQPSSAPAAVSSFSQYYQQQQQQRQQQQPQHSSRQQDTPTAPVIPNPPRTPTHVSTASAQALSPSAVSPKPPRTPAHVSTSSSQIRSEGGSSESVFSSHRELKPTFSSNIIRTPQHYNTTGSSSASAAARAATPTRASTREGSRGETALRSSSLASPPRHGRASSKTRYTPIDTDTETEDESPTRSHLHGPIYGPPTPSPAGRGNSSGSATSTQATRRDSSIPSLTSTMKSMSLETPPTSADSSVFLNTFTDEPGILSPLIVSSAPVPSKLSPSPVRRHATYPMVATSSQSPPGTIPAIPEESPSASLSRAPSRSSRMPKRSPSVHARTPGRSRTYPSLDPTLSGEPPVVPPMPSPTHMPPVVPSRVPSPVRAAKNPLPVPPMPSEYRSTASSSASASAAAANQATQDPHRRRTQSQARSSSRPPSDSYQNYSSQSSHQTSHASSHQPSHSHQSSAQASPHRQHSSHQASPRRSSNYSSSSSHQGPQASPSHSSPRRQVRHGFWNRRGDHLYQVHESSSSPRSITQYIVYAPRELANPEELAKYPHATAGWMNHRGEVLPYNPEVREHPDSLPSRGQDPRRPYSSFIRYVDV